MGNRDSQQRCAATCGFTGPITLRAGNMGTGHVDSRRVTASTNPESRIPNPGSPVTGIGDSGFATALRGNLRVHRSNYAVGDKNMGAG
ncbi:hypothetical protein XFF6992_490005 [Xanthomonas citri pv. fuscans]|nr:hypothetical protein XFF6992_490005 [Xanthomonas citri pv. fuscans]SOO34972.1 hypothetical protein XFF6994_4920003 [Xanthomonas citri pv. fuscans]